jgi:RNA polymerase sigma-B factor
LQRENQRSKLRVADEEKSGRRRRKRGGGATDAHVKSAAKGRPANGRPASGDVREAMMVRRYAQTRDPRLKEELAERFMPLARSLAMRYRGGSESLEDLVQVACLGLVKAFDGYDPARGRSFTGYAVPTMLGELRRHFRDRVWNVHLPRGLQERAMDVSGAIEQLSDQLGRSPTVAQIAIKLELSEEEVLEAMQADEARRTLSLDAPRARGDEESAPTVETVGREEMGYDAVDSQLAAADADLDERERLVLKLRFGRNLNQYEIGQRLGVSQMQISRIMRRALRKLLDAVQVDEADAQREVARLADERTAA